MLARYKTHCSVGKFCHLNLFSQLYASVTVCSLSFLGLWFLEAGSSADSQGKIILIRACFDVAFFFSAKAEKGFFLRKGMVKRIGTKTIFSFHAVNASANLKCGCPEAFQFHWLKTKKMHANIWIFWRILHCERKKGIGPNYLNRLNLPKWSLGCQPQ